MVLVVVVIVVVVKHDHMGAYDHHGHTVSLILAFLATPILTQQNYLFKVNA